MEESSSNETVSHEMETFQELLKLLGDRLTADFRSSLPGLSPDAVLRLKINAEVHSTNEEQTQCSPISLGTFHLRGRDLQRLVRDSSSHVASYPSPALSVERGPDSNSHLSESSGVTETNSDNSESHPSKRRKTSGGLRVEENSIETSVDVVSPAPSTGTTARQLKTQAREFPQRKRNDNGVHELQPSSVDKFIDGVWKQVFSSVELAPITTTLESRLDSMGISKGSDVESFRAVNSLCLNITKMSRCSRALETIVQAYWVDCYEARIKAIGSEKPFLSKTETKMCALREACSILKWSEKELRNKFAIWYGYKEIKDAGGWVCLVFAGPGIYRLCKYRVGFSKNLVTRLAKLRPSLEVVADTIHPEWRKLMGIIGRDSEIVYQGHPHDWVVCESAEPVSLKSTYTQWFPNFNFTHLEQSLLDPKVWGSNDPRRLPGVNAAFCSDCGYFQSDNVSANECRCFPELFGSCKTPTPVQVFRTAVGKNNGLIARCKLPRGSAIGEFTGLITSGMSETDVMQSGTKDLQYQIYQGQMGNYTRFINHSCAPNSQFRKFSWCGSERIIMVSRGIDAGDEITVDYSHEYWDGLDKVCLCGELCCRYSKRKS